MKDPAFLFYSSDFLTGVTDLTMEERGQYITLLCIQHQKGRLTPKMIQIAAREASNDVLSKFCKDDQGNFYNERLEVEAKKRSEHAEKQRQRALKGWEKRKKEKKKSDATADATALPLEDRDVNENIIRNESIKSHIEFENEELKKEWQEWIQYKSEQFDFIYKSFRSENAQLQKLIRLSDNKPKRAIKIIRQSMENTWKGFFPLKSNPRQKTPKPNPIKIPVKNDSIKKVGTKILPIDGRSESQKVHDNIQKQKVISQQ